MPIHRRTWLRGGALGLGGLLAAGAAPPVRGQPGAAAGSEVPLPAPARSGRMSLEEALQRRRSLRTHAARGLGLGEVAQLLWAAQGRTDAQGRRSAPSAGGLYPLEVLLVAGAVDGLAAGLYRYRSDDHRLQALAAGDLRAALAASTRAQGWAAEAPMQLIVTADPRQTTARYGDRAGRFVAIEVGHAAQNVYLQATALGLGTVVIGAFDEARLAAALELPAGRVPMVLMPVGAPR